MAFDALFVFGLFVAPALIGLSALGLLALWLAASYNATHPALRRSLWTVLIMSSGLALLLGLIIAVNVE